jgi:hypothetical protein
MPPTPAVAAPRAAAAVALPALPALPARALGDTSTSFPSHLRPRAGLMQCPRPAQRLRSPAAAVCSAQRPSSSWLSGVTFGGSLKRQQLHRSRRPTPGQHLPPVCAADIARAFEGDDGEESGAGAPRGDAASAARASFLQALHSPFDKEIFLLAIPALFSVLLDPVMGMVSTAIVGSRLGTASLAAVGLCTIVYNFSNFTFNFLLYSTTPRIAQAAAANDTDKVAQITSQVGALLPAACCAQARFPCPATVGLALASLLGQTILPPAHLLPSWAPVCRLAAPRAGPVGCRHHRLLHDCAAVVPVPRHLCRHGCQARRGSPGRGLHACALHRLPRHPLLLRAVGHLPGLQGHAVGGGQQAWQPSL